MYKVGISSEKIRSLYGMQVKINIINDLMYFNKKVILMFVCVLYVLGKI